jgi:hypothetical protein
MSGWPGCKSLSACPRTYDICASGVINVLIATLIPCLNRTQEDNHCKSRDINLGIESRAGRSKDSWFDFREGQVTFILSRTFRRFDCCFILYNTSVCNNLLSEPVIS